jgi:protein phosphatase
VALDSVAGEGALADYAPTRLIFTSGSATTVGRVRSQNQDASAVTQFDLRDDATGDAPFAVFLVSDGMGGEAHGEIASRIAARAVTVEMTRHFTLPTLLWPILSLGNDDADVNAAAAAGAVNPAGSASLAQALEQAVAEANRQTRVFARMLGAATGATLTVIAVSGARAALAHLGDSRAYLLREMRLIQLTEDHSLLARLIAMDHPLLSDPSFEAPRSVLYRSVGQEDEAPPDMLEFTFNPGDRVMLCSDGLWDELDDQTIGQELALATDPRQCAQRLVDLANAAGGHDNSTAVVVFVSAEQPTDVGLQGESSDAFAPIATSERDVNPENTDAASALEDSLGLYQPYNPDGLVGLDDLSDDASDTYADPIGLAATPQPSAAEGMSWDMQ